MLAHIVNQNLIEIYDLSQFNLSAIMHSGQVFRYFENEKTGGYTLYSGSHKASLYKKDNLIICECDSANYFYNYFDLSTDYNFIKNKLSKFDAIKNILTVSPETGGIRILKGDFLETVISFIISANNNIKRFTKTINVMCEKFGTNNFFPTMNELLTITIDDFKNLGCGYRAPYLVKTIKELSKPEYDFEILKALSRFELNKKLLSLSGVGQKVASCIILFCFNILHEVPIDTWIKKAIATLPDCDKQILTTHQFAGIAQQYIFYYLQHLKGSI